MLRLTLSEAINSNRINEFIDQEQERCIGLGECADMDAALKRPLTVTLRHRIEWVVTR